jgi:translation elongation factor EF-Tu-like GTPase
MHEDHMTAAITKVAEIHGSAAVDFTNIDKAPEGTERAASYVDRT